MSTRSLIGIELLDGKVKNVYCHWDGYRQKPGVGWKLLNHYMGQEKVEELIGYGNISSLKAEIGEKHDMYKDFDLTIKKNWTSFYIRDTKGVVGRVDAANEAKISTYEDLIDELKYSIDYVYVFRPKTGKWYFSMGANFRLLKIND